jgi:small-conductance mechanosensitive channel
MLNFADSSSNVSVLSAPLRLLTTLAVIALVLLISKNLVLAQTQGSPAGATATNTQSSGATPASAATITAPGAPHREAVVSYLGQVISWYRHLEVEQRLATEPAEILYLADDRQMAADIVKQAFAYARGEADLLKAANDSSGNTKNGAQHESSASSNSGLNELTTRRDQTQKDLDHDRTVLQGLRDSLAKAPQAQRADLNRQIVNLQGEIDLAQSRVDSINAMVDFETGSAGAGPGGAGLNDQIDELERSIPQANVDNSGKQQAAASAVAATTPLTPTSTVSGTFGRVGELIALKQKQATLSDVIDVTSRLADIVTKTRVPLLQALHDVDAEGSDLAKHANSSDLATIRQNKSGFEALSQKHKLVSAALMPLSKQLVLLNLYSENLSRWSGAVQQQFNETLRGLILGLFGLAMLLGAVFAGSHIWGRLTLRYVQDFQRRHQLLQLRRLTVIAIILLVLLFDFANELGALATVMGLAAAGIALALQNVILSVAGYFYLSGRFGIRIGDRVQISGINGDVLEVGLFKLTMMELTEDRTARQPTGRVVVFPNSVVFQPNGNFFKQAPGASFIWKEVRLTLAPECDYRLAEKRLLDVVNEVYARYRDAVQRESRAMETTLNVRIETPKPQSRMYLSETGLEMLIRYPVQTMAAAETVDEVSRRLVDAINRDPSLRLVSQAVPSIQPIVQPAPEESAQHPSDGNGVPQADAPAQPASPAQAAAPSSSPPPTKS